MIPATIAVRPLGQTWQTIGTLAHRGVWHEGLQPVSDQWGPKTCTFTLKRPSRALFPDLLADTPVIVEVAGVRVWSGRVKNTPETTGRDRQVSVECVGWQVHLDDRAFERVYVHTKLGDFKDVRSVLTADLTKHRAFGQVSNDNGVITLMIPNGTVVANGDEIGVVVDLGPGGACKRVVATVDSSNNSAVVQLLVRGSDVPYWNDASLQDYVAAVANNTFASTTVRGTTAATHRYVTLLMHCNAAFTAGADIYFRFKTVQCFADTAYESGDLSILTADKVILDALSRGGALLHPDRSGIGLPGFSFPDFSPSQPMNTREYIAAANAPSNWRFKIDEYQRPLYSARPTAPVIDLGAWPGAESDQGSSNSDEGITTEAIVRGQGPDGSPISVTRTQTGTIIDRQGGVRTKTLDTSFALTTALANKLGDTYLAAHRTSPFKGQAIVTAGGARRTYGGLPVHPAHLLLLTGELARRTDLVDPDTGNIGRAITIDQVTYRHDDQTSQVDLDNTRNDFETLMERLGLLIPG